MSQPVKVIWKFPLVLAPGTFEIELPDSHQIFSLAQMQSGINADGVIQVPVFWAIVNPESTKSKYKILCVFTGQSLDGILWRDYLGTVQHNGLVYHYFILNQL